MVARHWANRIRVEFYNYEDMMYTASRLLAGDIDTVYHEHKHLLDTSITNVPGRPIKLYFLKEMAAHLHPFYKS